jgi:hypothetical protein
LRVCFPSPPPSFPPLPQGQGSRGGERIGRKDGEGAETRATPPLWFALHTFLTGVGGALSGVGGWPPPLSPLF